MSVAALRISLFDRETGETRVHSFDHSPIRIGRHAIADVLLCSTDVSLLHAVLRFDGHKVILQDLRSTNGTLLDGVSVEPTRPLAVPPTSTITIGRIDLRATLVQSGGREPTGTIALDDGPQRVHAAVARLRPVYEDLRRRIAEELQDTVENLPLEAQGMAEAIFEREFPSLGERYPFAEEKLLERLCGEVPRDRVEEADALRRVESILRTLAAALCELHRSQVQLGIRLGVRLHDRPRALHFATQDPARLLSYLLARDVSEGKVLRELHELLTDLVRHPSALLKGAASGARELLHRLAPAEVLRRARRGRLTMRAPWNAYGTLHAALVRSDGYQGVLFGPAFVTAYGEHGGADETWSCVSEPRGQLRD